MVEPGNPSNRPLIFSAFITVVILVATSFLPVTHLLGRFLGELVLSVQIFAVAAYILIIIKYSMDSGLIQDYNPQMSIANVANDIFGPIFGLGTELITIVTYSQLSSLLFTGITFQEWGHDLSPNGPNYWLLTLFALFFLIISLLNLFSRINDARHYWSDLSDLKPLSSD